MVIGKAFFNSLHYAYFYYKRLTPVTIFPDILYSTKDDGEVLIEWDTERLSMLTFIDLSILPSKKHEIALKLAT
jgi:hypothetical protein